MILEPRSAGPQDRMAASFLVDERANLLFERMKALMRRVTVLLICALGVVAQDGLTQSRSPGRAGPPSGTPTYRGLWPGMPATAAVALMTRALGRAPECSGRGAHVLLCEFDGGTWPPDGSPLSGEVTIDDSTRRVAKVIVRRHLSDMETGAAQAAVLSGRWGPSVTGSRDHPPDVRHETWAGADWEAEVQWQVKAARMIGRYRFPRMSDFYVVLLSKPLTAVIAERRLNPEP